MPTPMPTPEASVSSIVASPGRSPLGTPEPSDQGSPELTPRDVQPAQPQESTPTGLNISKKKCYQSVVAGVYR